MEIFLVGTQVRWSMNRAHVVRILTHTFFIRDCLLWPWLIRTNNSALVRLYRFLCGIWRLLWYRLKPRNYAAKIQHSCSSEQRRAFCQRVQVVVGHGGACTLLSRELPCSLPTDIYLPSTLPFCLPLFVYHLSPQTKREAALWGKKARALRRYYISYRSV